MATGLTYSALATAQDSLNADLQARIQEFITKNPEVAIQSIYLRNKVDEKGNVTYEACSTVSAKIDGNTVVRQTDKNP